MTRNSQNASVDLDRMLQPDEALAIVFEQARPLPIESVPIADAAWRVLAADIHASEDHPPFRAATMDGYAVFADDVSPWREIIGVQTAGSMIDVEVTDGYAVRITTGAPVPPGADAVVKVEETELADDHVIIHQTHVASGENIRPIGSDVRAGDLVLSRGTILGPAEIGLAAGLGYDTLPVSRRARVSVLSTGDELVDPGEPLGPGQIRDSNRFSLLAALQSTGAEIVWSGKAPDERPALESLLQELIAQSDVLVTSGGVSMGELDLIKAILADIATVHFRRLFMKPGKPLNFASVGETLIFGLSGNPVSSLVGFEVFVRPALAILSGRTQTQQPKVPVVLMETVTPSDRIEYQRGIVQVASDGRLIARTTGSQQSSRLASLVGANALIIVPPGQSSYESGATLEAMLLAPPSAAT